MPSRIRALQIYAAAPHIFPVFVSFLSAKGLVSHNKRAGTKYDIICILKVKIARYDTIAPSSTPKFLLSTQLVLLIQVKSLASWLDRPLFPWKRLVIGFSLGEFTLENWLLYRQYRVLCQTVRPKALHSEIDQETYDKSQVKPFP